MRDYCSLPTGFTREIYRPIGLSVVHLENYADTVKRKLKKENSFAFT